VQARRGRGRGGMKNGGKSSAKASGERGGQEGKGGKVNHSDAPQAERSSEKKTTWRTPRQEKVLVKVAVAKPGEFKRKGLGRNARAQGKEMGGRTGEVHAVPPADRRGPKVRKNRGKSESAGDRKTTGGVPGHKES